MDSNISLEFNSFGNKFVCYIEIPTGIRFIEELLYNMENDAYHCGFTLVGFSRQN